MKKISSILIGLVLGTTSTLGIGKVAVAECNVFGCSEVPGVECNVHGCPTPPNGKECNVYGCPPPTSTPTPTPTTTPTPTPTPTPTTTPTTTPQRESVADCITKILRIDSDEDEEPDYSKDEAREICVGN